VATIASRAAGALVALSTAFVAIQCSGDRPVNNSIAKRFDSST